MGFKFNGACNFVLDVKLRALKAVLKSLNKYMFGLIEARKGVVF